MRTIASTLRRLFHLLPELHPGVLAALLLTASLANGQQISFVSQKMLPMPGQPIGVAAGKFNSGSVPDYLAVDYENNLLYCYLGNGDGTFGAPTTVATGNNPGLVTAVDLDNDLKQDALVVNETDNSITVFHGFGNGSFTAGATYTFPSTPRGMTVDDFNQDGRPDLAVAVGDSVDVMMGTGFRTFDPYVSYYAGNGIFAVASGTLDAGSSPDLVAAVYATDSVAVLLNTGTGTFNPRVEYFTAYSPTGVALVDLNSDSKLDIVTTSAATDSLSILRGNGNGSFMAPVYYDMFSRQTSVVANDLDGDLHTDLAVITQAHTVGVMLGTGNNSGMLQGPYFYGIGGGSRNLVVDDFTGDHINDLLTAGFYDRNVGLLAGDGGSHFVATPGFPTRLAPSSIAVDDFNLDGYPDFAVALSNDNQIGVSICRGGPSYNPISFYTVGTLPAQIISGEVIASGNATDLVVTNFGSNTVSVLRGQLSGTFDAAVNFPTGNGPVGVAVGDLNGDDLNDIVTADYNANTISVLINNGGGSFSAPVSYSAGTTPAGIQLVDVNNDFVLDAIVTNQFGNTVMIFPGVGNGTFDGGIPYPTINQPRWLRVALLDGDTNPDLVILSSSGDSVCTLRGNGDGTFQPYVSWYAGSSLTGLSVTDVDNDGRQDIVTSLSNGPNLSILRGNGNGTFQTAQAFSGGGASQDVAFGDFGNDNKPDFFVTNDMGSVTLFQNNSIAPPVFSASTNHITFPNTLPGNSALETPYIQNIGESDLVITSVVSDNPDFTVDPTSGTFTRSDGALFNITFSPSSIGNHSGHVIFTHNGPTSPDTIFVEGASGISVSIVKVVDADGDTATTGDQTPRRWHLELYKNFYTPGRLVASGDTSSLFAGLSSAGICIAVESDSGPSWTRLNGNRTRFDTLDISMDGIVDTFVNYRHPYFSGTPSPLDLGNAYLGDSAAANLTVTNAGGGILNMPLVTSTNPVFRTVAAAGPLASGSSQLVRVVYTPVVHGNAAGYLIFHHNAPNAIDSIQVFGTGLDTLRYRSFTAESLAAAYKQKPIKKPKPGKPVLMPNYANLLKEVMDSGAVVTVGISHQFYPGGKEKAYILPKKYSDIFATLNYKGRIDTAAPRGFDLTLKGKLLAKKQKSIPPGTQDNRLKSDLMALQVNMAASDHGKTPAGFADLVYNGGEGNPLSGLTVDSIAAFGNNLITNWEGQCADDYTNLDTTVRAINGSFSAAFDTASWMRNPGLVIPGAHPLGQVSFLRKVPSSVPRTVAYQPANEAEPSVFALEQNYPNPFNPVTTIEFTLPSAMNVTLTIYDILGRQVGMLLDHEQYDAGVQAVQFNASAISSGVYFYRMDAEPVAGTTGQHMFQMHRMVLLK